MAVDATGVSLINIEGNLPTYSIALVDYVPYTTATDMVVIQNPATSTAMIRITQIRISGSSTSGAQMDFYTNIRTALNTGGTSATVSNAIYDSNDPAAQAVPLSYSAAPTLNGTAKLARADRVFLPANAAGSFLVWEFSVRGGAKAIHLRPGQQLSINNNGNAVAAGTSLYIGVEWTESVGSSPVQ